MKPIFTDDFAALVPDEHRWFSPFAAALQRLKLPVRRTVLGDGVLRVILEGGHRGEWEAMIRPVADGTLGWRSSERYVLAYSDLPTLGPVQKRMLDIVWRVVEKFDPHLPDRFQGFAYAGKRTGDPAADLQAVFPFVTVERSRQARGEVTEVLVRTTTRCNQACPFCSGPLHDRPDGEMLLACISAAARWLPGAMLSLTGGEPTLHPDFMELMEAVSRTEGIGAIQVQTNAVRFAKAVDPSEIPVQQRLSFFVSLHGVDEDIYDECTGTRGQLGNALAGLERIIRAGHRTTVNTVVTRANVDHLEAMAHALATRFADVHRPVWHFSSLICSDRSPQADEYLVEYGRLVPSVARATEIGEQLGLEIESLLSSTHAAVPPCVVPPELRMSGRAAVEARRGETGYEDFERPWVKAKTCRSCTEDQSCLGVPTPYAHKFGLEELVPLQSGEQ